MVFKVMSGVASSMALVLGVAVSISAHATGVLTREPAPVAPQGVKDIQALIGD